MKSIKVTLYGTTVGFLYTNNSDLVTDNYFEFSDEYVNSRYNVSPIMLPPKPGVTRFVTKSDCFKGLPHFLADALPDTHGTNIIRAYFKNRTVDVYDMLSYIGSGAMGALEFEPPYPRSASVQEAIDLQYMVQQSRNALSGNFEDIVDDFIQISTSAGGARAKALIGYNAETNHIAYGKYDIPKGHEYYLIKFDADNLGNPLGYTNLEYAYYLMAKEVGIDIMPSLLIRDQEGRNHFATKRFDRDKGNKIHTQTLCSMIGVDFNYPGTTSYAAYFGLASNFSLDYAARLEMFRRMAFNILMVNRDDHTKNFSFMMSPEGVWGLAPAYDVTYAHAPESGKFTANHQLRINNKIKDISLDDLLIEAECLSLKRGDMIHAVQRICEVAQDISHYTKQSEVTHERFEKTQNSILTVNSELLSEVKNQDKPKVHFKP